MWVRLEDDGSVYYTFEVIEEFQQRLFGRVICCKKNYYPSGSTIEPLRSICRKLEPHEVVAYKLLGKWYE